MLADDDSPIIRTSFVSLFVAKVKRNFCVLAKRPKTRAKKRILIIGTAGT